MLAWLFRRFRRRSEVHEPEVEASQAEQKRRFADWERQLAEVARVERIAETSHRKLHRPR